MAVLAKKGTHSATLPWWSEPASIIVGLTAFVAYSIWAVLQGSHYSWGPYLSPYYSPLLHVRGLSWLSPAILVVWVPLGLRTTCYYFRRAYYRSFFGHPIGSARQDFSHSSHYSGETRFPLVLQHLHRYFYYLAVIAWIFLVYDGVHAFIYHHRLWIGVGSLIISLDLILLALYLSSCHSLRHLVGGGVDCYACVRAGASRRVAWRIVSKLNPYHWLFAWLSLIWVAFCDVYVRLVASGVWHDFHHVF